MPLPRPETAANGFRSAPTDAAARLAAAGGREGPFSIKCYAVETCRLLEVLNSWLDGRRWSAAGTSTIADLATYPWAWAHVWAPSLC